MWSPHGFDAYRAKYPSTVAIDWPDLALTYAFTDAWDGWDDLTVDGRLHLYAEDYAVVFVRGFLGSWMRGHLDEPAAAMRAVGFDAFVARTHAGATVEDNAAGLLAQIDTTRQIVFCGHSKGALECLVALDRSEALRAQTAGVLMTQAPRGGAPMLESLLGSATTSDWRHAAESWLQRAGLTLVRAVAGGRQLTAAGLAPVLTALDAVERPYPVWQTASWSSSATPGMEGFHQRLSELRPGCAHDGQFLIEDLHWPGLPHILLPEVDHLQPALGGLGFDHVRYWKILVAMALSSEQGGI